MAGIALTNSISAERRARKNRYRPDPILLAVPGVLFLGAFFLWPAVQVMLTAIFSDENQLDLSVFQHFFGSVVYRRTMLWTFVAALDAAVLCVLFGYPVAYWLSFRNAKTQRTLLMLILLPFWTSALVKNFAWMVVLGRTGIASQILAGVGIKGDTLLYNTWIVIFGIVHSLLPMAIIAMLPTFNQVNKNLLSAAATLGASKTQCFFRIFLPLSMRGVAVSGLIVFIATLGFFITPSLLGSPRETMIGQVIIDQIMELQNLRQGSAFGIILLFGAILGVVFVDRLFGLSSIAGGSGNVGANSKVRKYGLMLAATVGDLLDGTRRYFDRYLPRVPGSIILSLYSSVIILVLLVPVVALIPMALTSGSFLEFPPPGLSLRWFHAYFESPVWQAATMRSFGIGLATAIATTVIATSVALGVARTRGRLGGAVFVLFMCPMMVPPIVIAIGLFNEFARLSLLATDIGLVIGHCVIAMPVVFVIVLSTLKGHDWRLDDAALTLGASPVRVLRYITLPLVRTGLIAGAITGFLVSFEELTIALFIGGGLITTLPKQLWTDIFLQINPTLAAASVVVLIVVTVLFLAMERLRSGFAGDRAAIKTR